MFEGISVCLCVGPRFSFILLRPVSNKTGFRFSSFFFSPYVLFSADAVKDRFHFSWCSVCLQMWRKFAFVLISVRERERERGGGQTDRQTERGGVILNVADGENNDV